MGGLEQMLRLPLSPTSSVVASDGTDVFMSFHFETMSINDARELAKALNHWMHWFYDQQDLIAIEMHEDEYHGE
jgi:hypothetical protein